MTVPEFSAELKALFVEHELTVGYAQLTTRMDAVGWVCFVGTEMGVGSTPEAAIAEALETKEAAR